MLLTFDLGNFFLMRKEKHKHTHTHPTFQNISLQSKTGFHTFFLTIYLGTFTAIQFVSATRVVMVELVSKGTTDKKVPNSEGWR